MPLHLIIDGYNLIRQSAELTPLDRQGLEFGRDALVDKLVAYRRVRKHKITIVFDGSATYFFPDGETSWKGINVKFTRHGETADSMIKKMVSRERERAIVVSSDNEVVGFAAAHGAVTIPSEEFEEKLLMAEAMGEGRFEEEGRVSPKPESGTKKKGPSRKLPKRQRRARQKIKKL